MNNLKDLCKIFKEKNEEEISLTENEGVDYYANGKTNFLKLKEEKKYAVSSIQYKKLEESPASNKNKSENNK